MVGAEFGECLDVPDVEVVVEAGRDDSFRLFRVGQAAHIVLKSEFDLNRK